MDIQKAVYEFTEAHFGQELKHSDHDEALRELISSALQEQADQIVAMRAALEAAPSCVGSTGFECQYYDWWNGVRTHAPTGTAAPKPAANVAALVVVKNDLRTLQGYIGGNPMAAKFCLLISEKLDAALAQFEAGEAGRE